MTNHVRTALSLGLLLLAACSGPARDTARSDGKGIAFESSGYDAALQKAHAEGKLVMLDVYTDWCGWCRKMDREVFADEAVGRASRGLVALRVNAEDGGEDVARRYAVEGYPTVLFVDGKGKLVKRVEGYVDRDAMLAILRALPPPA